MESKRSRRRTTWYKKAILVLLGLALALGVGEVGLALYDRHFRWGEFRIPIAYTEGSDRDQIGVVVLGGSTAQGSPTARFSMGTPLQGLLYARCGMGARLQVSATGGWALEDAMRAWWDNATVRPDVMIVYSGHNQILRHYPPGMKPPPLGFLGRLRTGRALLHWLCVRQPYEENKTYRGGLFCDRPIPWHEVEVGLADYRAQLELLIRHCRENDIFLVLVVPACNYVMPPNRSHYDGPPQRRAEALALFKRAFHSKYFQDDDDRALALLRELAGFCSFAHLHYELGEIYYRRGETRQAFDQLARARDLDGYWVRMPSVYRRIIFELGAEHGVPVVDMRRVIMETLGRAVPDAAVFYDHVHFKPEAYMALEEEILNVLLRERVGGLSHVPEPLPLPAEWHQRIVVSGPNRAAILAQAMQETRTAATDETFMKYPVYLIVRDRLRSIETSPLPPGSRESIARELERLEVLIAVERQRILQWTRTP